MSGNTQPLSNMDLVADPRTPPCLLPDYMQPGDNTNAVLTRHAALHIAMQERLSDDQRELLYSRYWSRLTLREIAEQYGSTASAVSKRIKGAESVLRDYIGFYMEVHESIERRSPGEAGPAQQGDVDVPGKGDDGR